MGVLTFVAVHGTWVSDKKVEPGVRVELKEGDTVRVGGSSRVYRLHWIPFSCAYDSENPFVPPAFEDKEDENAEDVYQVRQFFAFTTHKLFVGLFLIFFFLRFFYYYWGCFRMLNLYLLKREIHW